MIVLVEEFLEVDPLLLLVRRPERARRHPAGHRESAEVGRFGDQFDRPGHVLSPADQPFPFERLEVADDAIGGTDVESLTDLPNGGAVATVLDLVTDKGVDLELPLGRRVGALIGGHIAPDAENRIAMRDRRARRQRRCDIAGGGRGLRWRSPSAGRLSWGNRLPGDGRFSGTNGLADRGRGRLGGFSADRHGCLDVREVEPEHKPDINIGILLYARSFLLPRGAMAESAVDPRPMKEGVAALKRELNARRRRRPRQHGAVGARGSWRGRIRR